MKTVVLEKRDHSVKRGDVCPEMTPNLTEDSVFEVDGKRVGFYLTKLPERMKKLLKIADFELNSDRVPKTPMDRIKIIEENGETKHHIVTQFSALLGAIPPKALVKRHYANIARTHESESAKNFIKAMLLLAHEAEEKIKEIMPDQFAEQEKIICENVVEKFRFGRLFTSSISNCNIAAPFHVDNANLRGTVNAIFTTRKNSTGGNLVVPDFDFVFESPDCSLLVYPAWANIHGVTPIVPTRPGGYRNSLVFYPLRITAKK